MSQGQAKAAATLSDREQKHVKKGQKLTSQRYQAERRLSTTTQRLTQAKAIAKALGNAGPVEGIATFIEAIHQEDLAAFNKADVKLKNFRFFSAKRAAKDEAQKKVELARQTFTESAPKTQELYDKARAAAQGGALAGNEAIKVPAITPEEQADTDIKALRSLAKKTGLASAVAHLVNATPLQGEDKLRARRILGF